MADIICQTIWSFDTTHIGHLSNITDRLPSKVIWDVTTLNADEKKHITCKNTKYINFDDLISVSTSMGIPIITIRRFLYWESLYPEQWCLYWNGALWHYQITIKMKSPHMSKTNQRNGALWHYQITIKIKYPHMSKTNQRNGALWHYQITIKIKYPHMSKTNQRNGALWHYQITNKN